MSNELRVSGPVAIKSDAPSRVAFDLMIQIANQENDQKNNSHRDYWLKLYGQCYKATNGSMINTVLNQN